MARWILVAMAMFGAGAALLLGGKMVFFIVSGLIIGYVLQRSGFCFMGVISDWYFLRQGTGIRAIIILLGVSLLGFATIQNYFQQQGLFVGFVLPLNAATLLGGLIFGIGMVLSGGCTLSNMARAGEGSGIAWVAIAGVAMGSTVGSWNYAQWYGWRRITVFLPETIGFVAAVALQIVVLSIIWWVFSRIEKSKAGRGERDSN